MGCGFKGVSPNQIMVVSGACHSEPKYITGGRTWVWPWCQKVQKLPLNIMTAIIESREVLSQEGVKISVSGVAQVKVEAKFAEMRAAACQHFMGKNPSEIESIVMQTLEGHQRAIMGTMTVEEIYMDRKKFAEAVYRVASPDLQAMGITIVSYTLKDVRDANGYLESLGQKRTAEVRTDARIGTAEAERDASIRQAKAEEERLAAKYQCDTAIASAERDYNVAQEEYNSRVNTVEADATLAYNLENAKTQQRIKEEEMNVMVVEKQMQIELAKQESLRKEMALQSEIYLPSAAECEKKTILGEAMKAKLQSGCDAQAHAIKLKGDAEAQAIQAEGEAMAQAMEARAKAWDRYGNAAVADMTFSVLPKVTAEVAAPIAQMNKLTMISADDDDIGAARLTSEIVEIITQLPAVVNKVTGLDITKLIHDGMNNTSTRNVATR
ncbi:hypothetical protein SARC_03069 [Sphaeroforma arctica JP610]|uniref:Band 7 domain-containing protein n=1 Tax=Sphaeroforma arctica JP610 TaxID=667725 RepID=A0A0L0G909_9EUKA|nr:hypothetical protein SARC_03069 [Sphaeroforma arctica JP610]KNC84728.1 hypothetical protein SARC_03069 [Sphaeroforma arctica JP610]|eukprot:XP_014158630.1 hypothetical protein SARC_03069 [Sphaeroforma arctica JP610]